MVHDDLANYKSTMVTADGKAEDADGIKLVATSVVSLNWLPQPDAAAETLQGIWCPAVAKFIGEHGGIHNFTVGQRKVLGVATGTTETAEPPQTKILE